MSRRSVTVADLASEANLELDEVLIRLWDSGIDTVNKPSDSIPARHTRQAREALGLPSPSDMKRRAYWEEALGLSPSEFESLLSNLEVVLAPDARNLPKGALAKIRKYFEEEEFGLPGDTSVRNEPPKPAIKSEPLHWRAVGRSREIRYLDEAQILRIHDKLVADYEQSDDPFGPFGMRSEHLLGSAVSRQHTSLGEEAKYPTVEMAAAALLHSIVTDHPFHNGNKRTGLVAMLVLLYENDIRLVCSKDDLFQIVMKTAQHTLVDSRLDFLADREVLALAEWLRTVTVNVERGERVITWLKLKRILSGFGVTASHPNTGNRIDLHRTVTVKRSLVRRRPTPRPLHIQVAFARDGADVSKNTVADIRRALHLDEAHGCDSKQFYESADPPADFIAEYQQVLRRLARL